MRLFFAQYVHTLVDKNNGFLKQFQDLLIA